LTTVADSNAEERQQPAAGMFIFACTECWIIQ
jgi:hypothetical protein